MTSSVPSGFCLWLTGLPSAGKTTLSRELAPLLRARGRKVEILDGDEVRRGLSADLGFDRTSREQHAMRVAFVAKVLVRNDVVPIVALISPYARSRREARRQIGRFVEVFLRTPLEVCEQRDVKGLYRKARAGEIHDFTGVDDPYEPPDDAEVVLDTTRMSPQESAQYVVGELERLGWLLPAPHVGVAAAAVPADR